MTSYRQMQAAEAKAARKAERDAKRDDKLAVTDAKLSLYNTKAEELTPFVKGYWRAITEAWQHKITTQAEDRRFLAEHGLMESYQGNSSWSPMQSWHRESHYYWTPGLHEIQQALR